MSEVTLSQRISRINPLQIMITILAVVTGFIHLDRGMTTSSMMGHLGGSLPSGLPPTLPPPPNPPGPCTGGACSNSVMYPGGGWSGGPPRIPVSGPPGLPTGGPSIMTMLPLPLPVLFYLNFIGYIVLIAALYLPALLQFQPLLRYQRVFRWLLIVYAAVTIGLWFLITGAHFTILAYIDKPIEVALIVLLLVDDRQASRQARLQREG
jgi:hypothetical protein